MRNRPIVWFWSFVLCFLFVGIEQKMSAQGTSTAEERTRWAEITHKLESNPLDESVNKDSEWALNRLSDAHDIQVPLCPALLGEFNDAKYKYRHQITRQYMLASGAFLIENPAKAGDTNAMNLAPRTESSDSNRERHPFFCIIARVSGGTWSVIKVSWFSAQNGAKRIRTNQHAVCVRG